MSQNYDDPPEPRFKVGDRIQLIPDFESESARSRKGSWTSQGFSVGTVTRVGTDRSGYMGFENNEQRGDDLWPERYSVRWDVFDRYGSDEDCHTVNGRIVVAEGPSDDEVEEALASIRSVTQVTP